MAQNSNSLNFQQPARGAFLCSGLPVASQWPPQWPPSGLPSGLPFFLSFSVFRIETKKNHVFLSFTSFNREMQNRCKKWEATGEATGRPLRRPLGGHWEATVYLRNRVFVLMLPQTGGRSRPRSTYENVCLCGCSLKQKANLAKKKLDTMGCWT